MMDYIISSINDTLEKLNTNDENMKDKLNLLEYMEFKLALKSIITLLKFGLFEVAEYANNNYAVNIFENLKTLLINAYGYMDESVEIMDNILYNYNNLFYFEKKLEEYGLNQEYIDLFMNTNKKVKSVETNMNKNLFKSFKKLLIEMLNDFKKLNEFIKTHENEIIDRIVRCEFEDGICKKNGALYYKVSNKEVMKIKKKDDRYEIKNIYINECYEIWKSNNANLDLDDFKYKLRNYPLLYSYYFTEELI